MSTSKAPLPEVEICSDMLGFTQEAWPQSLYPDHRRAILPSWRWGLSRRMLPATLLLATILSILLTVVQQVLVAPFVGGIAVSLLINFTGTMTLAFGLVMLFEFLVLRHLRHILRQADQTWLAGSRLLKLNRAPDKPRDELDQIVTLLDAARDTAHAAHQQLSWQLEETRQLNTRLQDNGREQSAFTYAISHDLKSPTNTILMLSKDLREELGELDNEEATDLLNDIETTAARMIQLVEDILAYSRTMGEDLILEPVDLNSELPEILRDISGDLTTAGAEIELGEFPIIAANRMQMRMVMQNLISNGIKFRDPERPPRVVVGCDENLDAEELRISVSDNGIGIAHEHFAKIFGLFQRLHSRSEYQGTGIGLAVCDRIAANHGGRLELTSDVGVGSTFTLVLPQWAKKTEGLSAA